MDIIFPIFTWWLALQAMSLVGMPFTILLFRHFPLHGYPFNKSVSVLLVGYVSWLLAMLGLGPFKSVSVVLALLLLAGIGVWICRWNNIKIVFPRLRKQWRSILLFELVFGILLLAALWLRCHGAAGAAIIGTEKPMDLAFLSAMIESPTYPPYDPWLAGYAVNYYYLGYVLLAAIAVISKVAVGEAFNLGIATIFALTALTIAGLIGAMIHFAQRRISHSRRTAVALTSLLGVFMVLILGNQAGALQVIFGSPAMVTLDTRQFIDAVRQRISRAESIQIRPAIQTGDFDRIDSIHPSAAAFNWWWPSRAVWDTTAATPDTVTRQYTITEFPFFSFYLADLHPHVLGLPFGLLAMALALEVISLRKPPAFFGNKTAWGRLIVTGIALGSLYMINSWDAPTYALIYFGALLLSFRRDQIIHARPIPLRQAAQAFGLLAAGCVLAILPFLITFQSFAGGSVSQPWANLPIISTIGKLIAPAPGHTNEYAFFSIFGLSCFILLVYATRVVSPQGTSNETQSRAIGWQEWIVIAAVSVTGMVLGFPLLALLPVVLFLAWQSWCQAHRPAHAFLMLAASVGLVVILIADMIYIRDPFENRMNTVFKFYYQAWIILGVMATYAAWELLQSNLRRHWFTPVWVAVAIGLFSGGMVYPLETLLDGQPWMQSRWELDGLAFLERQNPGEAEALAWIRQNTSPTATILTAVGSSYDGDTGRVASATGRPTLLGWSGSHERFWRSGSSQVLAIISERERDIPEIYTTTDIAVAGQLLEKYDVDYVYIGPKERQLYTSLGLTKFDKILTPVFSQGEVQIYQRDK